MHGPRDAPGAACDRDRWVGDAQAARANISAPCLPAHTLTRNLSTKSGQGQLSKWKGPALFPWLMKCHESLAGCDQSVKEKRPVGEGVSVPT